MSDSPQRSEVFPVGPPASVEYQVGRREDIDRGVAAVRGGDHIVFSDLRRAGKSTVALAVLSEVGRPGPGGGDALLTFDADLRNGFGSSRALADELARQHAAYGSLADQGRDVGRRMARRLWERGERVDASALGSETQAAVTSVFAALGPDKADVDRLQAALDAIERQAAAGGTRAVVLIDEAQDLARWPDTDSVQALLRRRLRLSGRRTTFMFAGSEPSMMDTLFAPDGALHFDGQRMRLSPINEEMALDELRASFASLGRSIDKDALHGVLLAGDGRPLRLMLIANKADRIAAEVTLDTITADVVGQAIAEARKDALWNAAPAP